MDAWREDLLANAGRVAARSLDSLERIFSPFVRVAAARYSLLLTFAIITVTRLAGALDQGNLALDLKIYRAAAKAVLDGRDPWMASVNDIVFAATPPTLLAYLPSALITEDVAIGLYGVVTVAAAVYVIRTLRLPLWWLLFPPIAEGVFLLNPDVLVIALLVASGSVVQGLSVPLKIYAVVPLVMGGRWRPVVVGGALCLLSVPLWPLFLSGRERIQDALSTQSFGGLSAWGNWLMVPTIIALAIIWRRGAEWLAVPALWPFTQLHYNVLGLPVAARSFLVAFTLSLPVSALPAVATILYTVQLAVIHLAAPYRAGGRSHPGDLGTRDPRPPPVTGWP